jgi:hypothetical protein
MGSNPRSTTLKVSTLTIALPMQFKANMKNVETLAESIHIFASEENLSVNNNYIISEL